MRPSALPRTAAPIPVARPLLPTLADAMPYLAEIDRERVYTNRGPLCQRFEARLARRFGTAPQHVITVANGTLGLTLALMAQNPPAGARCLVPAWTFAATPQAALLAGLVPYFVDVSAEDWAVSPETVREAVRRSEVPVGAVMVVAPFGQPIDPGPWEQLADDLGVAVVIDCAAGFDALVPSRILTVVSLHATKVFGVGEGGLVVSTDAPLLDRLRRSANFGFSGSRDAVLPAINAKLSEYHAAIGLAALDGWPRMRAAFERVALGYRDALAASTGVRLQAGYGTQWVAANTVVRFPETPARPVAEALAAEGVDTRAWWSSGAHRHPALAALPRAEDLGVTEALAAHTLGVPCFADLSPEDVERVAKVIVGAVSR